MSVLFFGSSRVWRIKVSLLILQRWIKAPEFPSEVAGTVPTSLKRKRRAFENTYHSMPFACASGLLQAISPAPFAFTMASASRSSVRSQEERTDRRPGEERGGAALHPVAVPLPVVRGERMA